MKMLRALRKAKGITLKELGDAIGVAESTMSHYETGKRSPDFETLLRLGELFDVSVDYLLRGDIYTGQLEKNDISVSTEQIKIALFKGCENPSDKMLEEVMNYADFVVEREKKKEDSDG